MNQSTTFTKRMLVMATSALLCGTMGWAQAGQGAPGAAGQTPGTPNTQQPMDAQMNSQTNGMANSGQASSTDKMFVKKALQGGMAEVQLGQLTLQKSSNEQVKQFAQKMIDDHTKMGEQMKPVAQQIGVPVPTSVSKKDKAVMSKLQALSGTAYDQAYIKDMVKDHKEDLSEFQGEASSGQDQTVKDAATQGSQVISEHLQMIQQLAKDQNVTVAKN